MDLVPNSSREEFYKPDTSRRPAAELSDDALERRLTSMVGAESEATADVVELISEFERRSLFAPKSFPSMFEYCTKVFGYSEGAAYLRIYAGRLAREYPEILDLLRTRRLHLTAIRTVGPHLKPWNRRQILERSLSKSERELKFLIAELAPKPEPAEVVRRLPERAAKVDPEPAREFVPESPRASIEPEAEPAQPQRAAPASNREKIEPLTPRRVRFAFIGSEVFLGNYERVRELLRHKCPAGALEDIMFEVIEHFLKTKDPALKRRRVRRGRTDSRARAAPGWVKDAVFARDGGRCAYLSADGTRCSEKGGLEYDHIVPWALGGVSDDPGNIRLLCRAHNAFVAKQVFGDRLNQASKRRIKRNTATVAASRPMDSAGDAAASPA